MVTRRGRHREKKRERGGGLFEGLEGQLAKEK